MYEKPPAMMFAAMRPNVIMSWKPVSRRPLETHHVSILRLVEMFQLNFPLVLWRSFTGSYVPNVTRRSFCDVDRHDHRREANSEAQEDPAHEQSVLLRRSGAYQRSDCEDASG